MDKSIYLEDFREAYPKHYVRLIMRDNPEYYEAAVEYCRELGLDSNAKLLYHYAHDLDVIPDCKTCGDQIKVFGVNNNRAYNSFCGKSCAASNPEVIKLRVANRTESAIDILNKKKQTILSKDVVIDEKTFRQFINKMEDTNITNIEKTLIAHHPDIYNYYYKIHGDLNPNEVVYLIKNDMDKPHCPDCNIPLKFETYIKGYVSGCSTPACYGKASGRTKRAKHYHIWEPRLNAKNIKILSDIDQYVDDGVITLNCTKCDHTWDRKVHTTIHGGCPNCRVSKPEMEVFEFINEESKVSNTRKIIPPLELDIYIPNHSLAIEFNGIYWHSELSGKDKQYHLNKTKVCESKNIQLLHIFESEWKFKEDIWKSIINTKLGNNIRIYGRKCKIKEIDTSIKNEFLDYNHLQGQDKASIKLGLFHEEELVSVMTFCKSRFDKGYQWELSRFASKLNTSIIGGASKLLKYFTRNYKPESLISYANRRHSNGNLYKQLGFSFLRDSPPNYFYFKGSDCWDLKSRQQFQKHKLEDKLEEFDRNLSEWENMKINGYDRIWDCGNSVWSLIL
jgi:hypothetical protein|tara:strand:+ start:21817 stop:23502 length:1686 start_codon:yes stop_codon:yes gene_type:complete